MDHRAGRDAGVSQQLLSLFDVDEVQVMSPVRDMVVAPVSRADVDQFCQRWHYSKTGGNMTWNYGLWDGHVLVGCVSYNLPTLDVCKSVFGEEGASWVTHMGRLVCAENAPRIAESRLIAGSLRLFRHDYPQVRAVVTYAASGVGHIGYVYQATNALFCGLANPRHFYVDEHGRSRSTKQGQYLSIEDARTRGWAVRYDSAKYRYLYLLGSRSDRKQLLRMLKWPVLPYPKATP